MSLVRITMEYPGQVGIVPRKGSMLSNDDYATITTPGYLNTQQNSLNQNFYTTDLVCAAYSDGTPTGIAVKWFSFSISNGIVTLVDNIDAPSYVQEITPGFSAPSKALVLDESSSIDGVPLVAILNAASATTGQVQSVTTVSTTPATGSCGAQFQLKTFLGANIGYIAAIHLYISDSSGNIAAAASSIAALTNGVVAQLVSGRVALATSNISGQIGLTLTASAGTYYITFILPNGKTAISSALVCN